MTGYFWVCGVLVMVWITRSGSEMLASLSTSELPQAENNVTELVTGNTSFVQEMNTEKSSSPLTLPPSTILIESNNTLIDLERNLAAELNNAFSSVNLKNELTTVEGEVEITTEERERSKIWSTNITKGREYYGSLFGMTDNVSALSANTGVTTELFMTGNSNVVSREQEVVLHPTAAPSSILGDWNYSASTNALSKCYQMVTSERPSGRNMSLRFFTGIGGQKYAETWETTPWGRLMHIIIRFNYIGVVKEDMQWSYLCVGTYDMTAHTYWGEPRAVGQPVAWVTIHTLSQHTVGIVKLETRCFRQTTQFQDCSPEYYSLPFMNNIPIFKYSVLEEEFWARLSYTYIGVNFPWIWKINTNINTSTHFNNVPSTWIYKMDIPTLDELEIQGNNWGKFKKLFRPIPTLAYLDLSNNNMEMVPEDVLNSAPIIRRLILSYNNISEYPVGIRNLKELRHLDISFSKSMNVLLIQKENINSFSQKLNILELENTRLKVNVTDFFSLSEMTFLNLSRCMIEGFTDEIESNLWHRRFLRDSNLTKLDLSKNYISALTRDAFRKLTLLEMVDLSYNIIANIDPDTFQYNLLLKRIDLSYNKIKAVPICLFCELSKLEEVDLSHNQLTEIPYFVNVRLKYLGLSFNALNNFKQNNSFIDYIDMSNNNVSILQISLAKKLNLSYNWLSVITTELWDNLIRLQEVDLGGNNFECCSFKNATFLKETYGTTIFNLGSSAPLTCKISTGLTEFLLGTLDSKYSSCANREENASFDTEIQIIIGVAIIVIILFFLITIFLVGKRFILSCSHKMEMKGIYI